MCLWCMHSNCTCHGAAMRCHQVGCCLHDHSGFFGPDLASGEPYACFVFFATMNASVKSERRQRTVFLHEVSLLFIVLKFAWSVRAYAQCFQNCMYCLKDGSSKTAAIVISDSPVSLLTGVQW